MSKRDGYQHGVPCWVAAVEPDPDEAVSFYTELFGWEADDLMPPDSDGRYFACKLRGRDVAAVVSVAGGPPLPTGVWATHIWVDDAEQIAASAIEAGGSTVLGPFDSPAGYRLFVLADPAGAVFSISEPREHKGAHLVNEPGAWAMSMLNTPDPEGAKRFYRAVFDWETGAFGDVTLWRVPGYVGGEPMQPVPRDVVGVMAPLNGNGGVPPNWSVDFWVDDADRIAERATRLGGEVVVAPREVPGFRNAVLADPQGAMFSVSQLR
jgi:predicted enzyme related to lactoylglutathione lyase